MIKKKIKYMNLDDLEVTGEFHFNLTKAEIIELNLKYEGGLEGFAERISASTDQMEIYNEFKELLMISIGKREGNSFVKNARIREEFASSEAYSELLLEMLKDTAIAVEFFNGIMPAEIRLEVAKTNGNPNQETLAADLTRRPDAEPQKITKSDLIEMDNDTIKSLLATGAVIVED